MTAFSFFAPEAAEAGPKKVPKGARFQKDAEEGDLSVGRLSALPTQSSSLHFNHKL